MTVTPPRANGRQATPPAFAARTYPPRPILIRPRRRSTYRLRQLGSALLLLALGFAAGVAFALASLHGLLVRP